MDEVRKDSMVFYRSWLGAIDDVDDVAIKALCYEAIVRYGLDGKEIKLPKGYASIIFKQARPLLDKNHGRWINGKEGGKMGGAPKGNQNARKSTQKQPKNNPNVNVNVNDNVNANDNVNVEGEGNGSPTKIAYN